MTAWQRVTTKERRAEEGKTEWEDMRQRGRDKESEVGRGGGRHTYVDFTENDVYYAANYDEEIKHIPGITKVPLHRMRWARGGGG